MPPEIQFDRSLSRRELSYRRHSDGRSRRHRRRHGHHDPQDGRRQAERMDRDSGGARRRRGAARHPRPKVDIRSAGPARGLYAGADLCARQRLSEGLEGRHRHAGQSRRSSRRNRRARSRSADHAGRSRPRQRAGQFQALRRDAAARPAIDQFRRRVRSRISTKEPPTRPTSRAWSNRRRPISTACACSRNTSASPRRSTD